MEAFFFQLRDSKIFLRINLVITIVLEIVQIKFLCIYLMQFLGDLIIVDINLNL